MYYVLWVISAAVHEISRNYVSFLRDLVFVRC